jgi:hypothetical protein
LKIRRDIAAQGVVDTGGKWKKSSIMKVLIILFQHLWEVELSYRYIFAFKFTLRSHQPDIVPIICHRPLTPVANLPAGVLDTGGKLPPVSLTLAANLLPVSLTPVANLPPVSPTLAKLVAKFATSVKFATGFIDAGGAP